MITTADYYKNIDRYHEIAEASHAGLAISEELLGPFVLRDSWIIDVAGGTGFNAELLNIDPERYVSTDFSVKGLTMVTGKGRGSAVVCDAGRMPFRDGVCSTVLCSWSLEHFEEPEKALDEMIRMLQPGGRAIIWGPNWDNIFRKDFPQFVHKSRWFVESVRWRMFFRMLKNEFTRFRYAPFISTDVAAFAAPEKYISYDTDAVHSVLCQETVKFFEERGLAVVYLSDFSQWRRHVHNSLFIRTMRKLLTPVAPLIRRLPLLRWFVIRFPLVVEKPGRTR